MTTNATSPRTFTVDRNDGRPVLPGNLHINRLLSQWLDFAQPGRVRVFTGKVERIDKDFLQELIDRQVVPVVSPIGFGPDGRSLRVNSDLLAAEMAEALHATKIIYLTPAPGLEIDGDVRREIAVEALRKLLAEQPARLAVTQQRHHRLEHFDALHRFDVLLRGGALVFLELSLCAVQVGQHQFKLDRLHIANGIDAALNMHNVGVPG